MKKFLNWIFQLFNHKDSNKQANLIASIVVDQTNQQLEKYQLEINSRLREIKSQINIIDTNIALLDKKLSLKELKDKQQYGHIQYKMNQIKSN